MSRERHDSSSSSSSSNSSNNDSSDKNIMNKYATDTPLNGGAILFALVKKLLTKNINRSFDQS